MGTSSAQFFPFPGSSQVPSGGGGGGGGLSISSILDPTRFSDWNLVTGFSIPAYSTNCPIQPSLLTGSGNSSANKTAIQNALASCDSLHNVINIPAGTYYVDGWTYGSQGKQVVRGVSPSSTYIYITAQVSCGGDNHGICMINGSPTYNGSSLVLPPSGAQQCLWTSGYAQRTTSITLSSCGGTPPVGSMLILDQANDLTDTSGVYVCDTNIANCGYEGSSGGNNDGRFISGITHSQQQVTYITAVSGSGSGPYTVTISPGVYFNNIRSGQSPGAWWPGTVQNDGLENLTIDGTSVPGGNIAMYACYQCWVKNVRSINAGRNHVHVYLSAQDVVRDSYFYQSQAHYSESYVLESESASGFLVENNIFQQVTNPLMFGQASGAIIGYNFGINNIYTGAVGWMAASYNGHNAGNAMNLWESNNFVGIWNDNAWGSSNSGTYFRNMLAGWQSGDTHSTFPVLLRSYNRIFNLIGNVLGQPGYHNQYQAIATSPTVVSGGAAENTSIYSIGLGGTGAICGNTSGTSTSCDAFSYSTLMRWGNYDVVTAGVKWDPVEASPINVAYVNSNFDSTYFTSLAHSLTSSLYYSSKPAWWPVGKVWPTTGPDISGGNLGICTGSYAGSQATNSTLCSGGTLNSAWAGHANSIPAQDRYFNMGGPPDGSGPVLTF